MIACNVLMGKRILIVEDSPDLSQMIRIALEHAGYEIDCAVNGLEALKYLFQTEDLPDLILLDLMMPVMDGYEFRRLQMEIPRAAQIPVVIVTADGGFTDITGMKAQALLRKPADLGHILRVVHDQLNTWMEVRLG